MNLVLHEFLHFLNAEFYQIIGFSTNGKGKNKILTPKAKILAQVAKPRGQEILAWGVRILFLPKPLVENPILTNLVIG